MMDALHSTGLPRTTCPVCGENVGLNDHACPICLHLELRRMLPAEDACAIQQYYKLGKYMVDAALATELRLTKKCGENYELEVLQD